MSAINDKDSVKTLFTNNGVEISDEEADAAVAKFKACEAGGELDESALENVAGGGSNPVINFIEKAMAKLAARYYPAQQKKIRNPLTGKATKCWP